MTLATSGSDDHRQTGLNQITSKPNDTNDASESIKYVNNLQI